MPALEELRALDLADAHVTLWTIKGPTGPAAEAPAFRVDGWIRQMRSTPP